MAEVREWAVELIVTSEHAYTVLARTAEEAVGIAEDLFDSGDEGTVTATSIDQADAVSGAESLEDDEYEEGEEVELDIES
jgi:hypothetical protein